MNKEQLKELAATLNAIADGAEWEFNSKEYSVWAKPSAYSCPIALIGRGYEIRLKPRTININGFEVPEPVREPLKYGQEYWVASPISLNYCYSEKWEDASIDHKNLERGAIHLTQEAAGLHGKALASFTERKEGV